MTRAAAGAAGGLWPPKSCGRCWLPGGRFPGRAAGTWVAMLDHEHTARAHANATFPAITRALHLVADIGAWKSGLT